MNYIKITVREKRAKCNGRERIVCGNSDYVIKFDFDDEWAAYDTKTARFVVDGGKYTDVQFTGDEVGVPVLRDTRTVSVGCYAGDIRTTTAALIQAVPCCTDPDGTPADPAPDVYNQLMERFDKMEAPEAVLYTEQELTDKQKQQARKNIGVKPIAKTTDMTQDVGIDSEGKLYTKAGSSGTDISLGVTATVGQTIKVKTVGADGKPTAWEAVDMASGDLTWEKIADVTIEDNTAHIEQELPAGIKKLLVIGDPQAKALLSASAKIRLASASTGYNQEYFAESSGNLNGTWVGFYALVDFTVAGKPFALTWQGVNSGAMQASAQYIDFYRGTVPPTKMYITTPNGATAFNASKWHIWGAK